MDWQSVLKYNPNHDERGRFTFAGHGLAGAPGKATGGFAAEKNKAYRARQEAEGLVADEYKNLSSLAVELRLTEKYAAKHGQVYDLKGGIPFEMREVATALDNLAAEYPAHFKSLIGVALTSSGSAVRLGAWAEMDGSGRMFLNPNMWGTKEAASVQREGAFDARSALRNNLPHQLQESIDANYHPPGTNSIKSIIDHEFGHHFMNQESGYVGRTEKRGFGLLSMELQSILKDTDKKKPLLGEYSKVNQSEWFACAFAFAHGSSTDPRAKRAREAIRLYLTDYRKFVTEQQARLMRKGDFPGHPFRGNQYTTVAAYAEQEQVSESTARKRLEQMVFDGILDRKVLFEKKQYGKMLGRKQPPPHKTVTYTLKKKSDIAQTDLDQAGRLPPKQGPKRRRHGFKRMFQYGEGLVTQITKANPYHDPKTGRFTTKAMGFMKEWHEGTQAHPFDDRIRLRRYVGVEMSPYPGLDTVHLSSIISFGSKGKGEASQALAEITQMADERGITLDLTAKPIENAGAEGKNLTKAQLIKWYKRHGFEQEKYPLGPGLSDRMTRKPKTALQTSATKKADPVSFKDQFSTIFKFNPFHDERGRFTSAQNARQQEGHDELPTVEAMNRAMQLVGMEAFERAVMDHLDSIGRPVTGAEQAYEIERVARRIVAANRGAVKKCDFTMPISYFYEIGDAYRAFKYSESQPRDDRGRWTLAGSGFASPDTPEFKAWFGRSTVVDKDGTPMRVFHGTNREDITEFKAFSHFGTAQAANDRVKNLYDFSVDTVGRDPGNFQVMPLYLSMQNPLRLPDLASLEGSVEDDDGKPLMRAWEHENDLMEVLHERDVVTTDEFWEHQYDNNEEIIKLLEEKGYDGIVYTNAVEHKGRDSYIIFHPWQVKSASGNSGRYDPNDPHVAKFDESKHPREPAGTPKGGQFAAWRQGTGMYFDDKVWRYGGDHSAVPEQVAARLRALVIPPASINVHLNPDPTEPLQATWTARNGKLQYRYSADAMGNNAAEKFSRLKEFNAAMPKLRRHSRDDMLSGKTQADRDTAAVVNLMSKTGFRVGGAEEFETKKGKAYGASTLLDRHVVVNGNKLTFDFPGKHAVPQSHELNDMLLAQYIRNRKRHTTKDERLFSTNEGRINKYLKDVTGQPFSAKDFRTWHGTHTALKVLKQMDEITTEAEYRKARIHVGDAVAKHLGNTRMVALGSYIDPTVWGRWVGKEKKRVKV